MPRLPSLQPILVTLLVTPAAWRRPHKPAATRGVPDPGSSCRAAVPLSLEQRTTEQLASQPSGFFVLRAADADSAAAIARTVPHLQYGGTIMLYPIETTSMGGSGG